MKLVSRQTTTRTLADLYRALDRQQAVTITYRKDDGSESLRTLEPYDIRTTKAGGIIIRAMDRESGEARSFRLDRIEAYTLHRSAFQIERPTDTTEQEHPELATTADVIAFEIARDDADYFTEYTATLAA